MKARYIAIYKLRGANNLPEEAACANLCALQSPAATALLTTIPEPHFLHIDKSGALAALLLKGGLAEGWQKTLAAEIEDVKAKRAKQTSAGVFLVLDGVTDITTPEFTLRCDTEEFAVSLDAVDNSEIRARFQPAAEIVLMALSLCFPQNANRTIEKLGDVVFLIDPNDGKPIYNRSFQFFGARAWVASPLTEDVIAETAALAPKLVVQKGGMAKLVSLLTASLEDATSDLQSFISAWSALEIFVNSTFKSTYEARWFEIMEDGAPTSARPVFNRLKGVMRDKYRLADKFLVIASVLDSVAATKDWEEFQRVKDFRDRLFHNELRSSLLPTEAVQRLLLKYLKLHLLA